MSDGWMASPTHAYESEQIPYDREGQEAQHAAVHGTNKSDMS